MMIKKTYRKRILIAGIILSVVIPVGGMLAPFVSMAWSMVTGSAAQEQVGHTIRFLERTHWIRQICGIAGSILLVGLFIDYSRNNKKELR